MAILQCDMVQKRDRVNVTQDGGQSVFTATYTYPIGAQVTSGDILQIMDISALHTVEAVRVYTSDLDDGTTLTSNWGFSQLAPGTGYGGTNASGVAVDIDVATATTYASPATNATYFQSANAVVGRAAGWNSLTLANTGDINGAGGPIRMTCTWTNTPTQTTADDAARTIRIEVTVARSTPAASNFVDMGGY
jgi:hypothetical protein